MGRWAIAIAGALIVASGLYALMHVLTQSQGNPHRDAGDGISMDFIERPEREPQPQEREPPPKEPELAEKPPTPQAPQTRQTRRTPRSMEQTQVQTDIAVSSQFGDMPSLGKAPKGPAGLRGDPVRARHLQARQRVRPRYPKEAMGKRTEGRVKLVFTVTKEGKVTDARVVEAKPQGVFEEAALRAIRRWEFKPPQRDGQTQAVRAMQTFEFKLGG